MIESEIQDGLIRKSDWLDLGFILDGSGFGSLRKVAVKHSGCFRQCRGQYHRQCNGKLAVLLFLIMIVRASSVFISSENFPPRFARPKSTSKIIEPLSFWSFQDFFEIAIFIF